MDKQLCQAGFENDVDFIRLLNRCSFDLNQSNFDKRTVGHLAACENHRDMLLYLATETDFNFLFMDRFGKCPLGEIRDIHLHR